jgi:Flp pilus assembly protein TadD
VPVTAPAAVRDPAPRLPVPVSAPGAPAAPDARPGQAAGPRALRAARDALAGGDYAGAVAAAEDAVRAEPLGAQAYLVLGQALSNLGRDGDALAPLRKAVYLDPRAGHAHFLLGGALARVGQPGPAAVSYRAAAGSLASTPPEALADILDGREVGELVGLCRSLAEGCTRAAQTGERTAEGSRP